MLNSGLACAVLGVVVLVVPARAQFEQLGWHFVSESGSGGGQLTPSLMSITGPDFGFSGGCAGSTNAFLAMAPFDLTVVADYTFVNDDKFGCCADFLVTIVEGVETEITDKCYGCQVVLNAPAGSVFGFGVYSHDCKAGPGLVFLTNLQIIPAPSTIAVAGLAPGEQFGTAVASVGDLDGDSVPDVAAGAPLADVGGSDAGRVAVHSGADGSLLWSTIGSAASDHLGQSLAAGDVDTDGLADLIIGAPGSDASGLDAGAVSVRSGAGGGPLLLLQGDAVGDAYGSSVAFAGDVDDDGFGDILVGAPLHDGNGASSGLARLVSGADGSTLHTWLGTAAGDEFGRAVASTGDLDGDGRDDVIIGAPRANVLGNDSGLAQVFSGSDGALIRALTQQLCGSQNFDYFGQAVAGIGDVDGDDVADIAVGAPGDSCSTPAAGSVSVFSGATGGLLYMLPGHPGQYRFGSAIAAAGDVDADGVPDIAVGAPGNNVCCTAPAGHAYLISGDDGALIDAFTDAAPNWLGWSVASLGDLDGDGRDDVAIGAPLADPAVLDEGLVRLLAISPLWTDLGQSLPGSAGTPALQGKGLLIAGESVTLKLTPIAAPGPTALVIGSTVLGVPFKGGVMVPSPQFLITGLPGPSHGLVFSASWPAGIPAGFDLYFQMWIADPAAIHGLAASNAIRGTTP